MGFSRPLPRAPATAPLALDDAVKLLEKTIHQTQQEQVESLRRDLREAVEQERTRHSSSITRWWRRHTRPERHQSEQAALVADLVATMRAGLLQDLREEMRSLSRAERDSSDVADAVGRFIVFMALTALGSAVFIPVAFSACVALVMLGGVVLLLVVCAFA